MENINSNKGEYKITVRNRQTAEDFSDTVTETAQCRMRVSEGVLHIMYKTEDSSVIITAEDNTLRVKRSGESSSYIVYKAGYTHHFIYNMPFGGIDMTVHTERVRINADADGARIDVKYRLMSGGGEIVNDMKITVE